VKQEDFKPLHRMRTSRLRPTRVAICILSVIFYSPVMFLPTYGMNVGSIHIHMKHTGIVV